MPWSKLFLLVFNIALFTLLGYLLAKYKIVRIIFVTMIFNLLLILIMVESSSLRDFSEIEFPWHYPAILGLTTGILMVTGHRPPPKDVSK